MSPLSLDWQTWAAVGLGLLAAAHVAHRWLPKKRSSGPAASACGTSAEGAAGCRSGCGGCGQSAPSATKDHRIHIVRR